MNKPDETKIIRIFQQSFKKRSKFVPEDVEILRLNKAIVIAKSDMLVESTDVPPGMKINEIARKSMISCVSDFACKGIKPQYATVSLAIPKGFSISKIKKLATGFSMASKEYGVEIVGGDLNEGKEIVIDVSMFGISKKIVKRNGARINDIIITSGPFGYCSAGLKIILNHLKAGAKFTKKCKYYVNKPTPRLKFGLGISNHISSSMDSSDGLSATLNEMSRQSRKKFVITKLPTRPDVEKFAKANKIKLTDLVFCGGEEYEIVATVSRHNLDKVRQIAKMYKTPLFEIGYVTNGRNVVHCQENKLIPVKKCGWLHFKS
ncbi:MAG: thiamine-phosphate kinase [Thaumarchaeota archaeon]|nr:thiamine-phosphate kinase [Nitrososphaerota archaeon]MBI3639761.1 thiamine-phosphate kinase [Nitrososphaerota archaeon]